MEIERRWLVKELPPLESSSHVFIDQIYVESKEDSSVRVRRVYTNMRRIDHFLTVKTGKGIAREEVEVNISIKLFNAMAATSDQFIAKRRQYIQLEKSGPIIELDLFAGSLQGHLQAEVEFCCIEEAEAYVPPDWFGKEVTDDGRYTNASLAKYGLPKE